MPTKKLSANPLPPPTGLARQVLSHVLNSIAFGNYADQGSIDDIAVHLGKKPGSVRRAVNRLADQGYVTTKGEMLEMVYQTVAALRQQDPNLSETEAKELLKRIMR